MTLRAKTLLIIGMTLGILLLIMYLALRIILLSSFAALEEQYTREHVERALSVFNEDLAILDTIVADWAAWDDTYAFIQDANEKYVAANLLDGTLTNLRLNLMLFINSAGQIVASKSVDLDSGQGVPLPPSLQAHLSADSILLRHPDPESGITGTLLLPEGPLLLASRPIVTSEGQGPIRGTLIMGRFLNSAKIEHLAGIAHLSLTAHRLDDLQMPPDPKAASSAPFSLIGCVCHEVRPMLAASPPAISEEEPILIRPVSAESIAGYALLNDIYGQPALLLQVSMPRGIYRQGQVTLFYLALALVGVGLLFSWIMLLYLERVVLSPLTRLNADVSRIGARSDLSARVAMAGKDELASLANAINKMLEGLEGAQRERERLEEQFLQAQKMEAMGRLAGGIAHDFNNLLVAIMGYASFVRDGLSPGSQAHSDVAEIIKASERATNLTRQLLAFSRSQPLSPTILHPNDLILEMDKMLRRLIGDDIELVTITAPDIGSIKGDRTQLEQVLVNLIINARDAMPNGGKITIMTTNVTLKEGHPLPHPSLAPGDYVLLTINDTGCGMSEEVKTRIFEPFFTTKEPGRGTGLGLAAVYGIVKQHDGQISFESDLGKGTTFYIYFPRVKAGAETPPSWTEDTSLVRGTEKVLVVEDEPAVRSFVVRTLSEAGYQVLEAADGAQALRLVQKSGDIPLHLLVTDIAMPGMNGQELAERLRTAHPRLKTLFISAHLDNPLGDGGALLEGGAFLAKPFTPAALTRRVRELLEGL